MSNEIVTKEKLAADMKVVIKDAEELLRETASALGEKASAARHRLEGTLRDAKVKLIDAEKLVVEKTKQAAKATDTYVHENPWKAVGIAAGAGFVLGLLIRRR